MGPLSIRTGLSILSILYILVLQLFHLSFWSLTTNLGNLLGFSLCVSSCILDFVLYFFFLLFLIFLWGQKWVTTSGHKEKQVQPQCQTGIKK
jgi:hypothetical protein